MEKLFGKVILETNNVQLIPINIAHKADLIDASADSNLSELWFTSVPTIDHIDDYITKAIEDFIQDKGLAFVVLDKKQTRSLALPDIQMR